MSIDMYLGSSKAQGSSASALSESYQAGFQALQAAVGQFTQDTLLRSQAYDSGKSYFQGVYIPLIQGAILVAEATGKAVEKLPNDYVSQVDSCDLRSSELEAEIQRYETQIQGIQNQMDQIKQLLPVSSERVQHLREASGLISDYTSAKRKLEKQLQKLLAFHAFSSTLFTEVTSLQNAVNQGLAQVSGGKGFDSKTGTFSPKNLKDTRWMITIGNAWEKREKEIAEINRKARVEREIAALNEAAKIASADIAMNSFMMNVGLMNMGPSIYGNLKDYGSQKALTASLRPTGTMSRSNTKVSGTNGVLSGSKNGKNYVLDRSRSTGNTTYKKASGANPPKTDFGAENPVSGKDRNNYFKDKYGAGNVQWKNPVSSISELMENPSSLINVNPADVADFVKREGWTVTPLKKGGSAGIPYEEGGGFSMNPPKGTSGGSRYIQYHPGNGHHGEVPYYKISQPNKPTVRIYMDGRYEID